MPGIARKPSTMRLRRRAYSASITGTESMEPRMASRAAYCAMEVGFEVDWLCNLMEACTSGFGRERVADAPAGHGKRFRHRADDDDVIFRTGGAGDRVRFVRLIGEMRIALVAHEPDVMFLAKREDAFEFFGRNDAATGIAWRIQKHHARFRGDGLFDGRGLYREAIFALWLARKPACRRRISRCPG